MVSGGHPGPLIPSEVRVGLDEVSSWQSPRALIPRLLHFGEARCVTTDLRYLYSPLKSALALRALSRGRCWFEDDTGSTREVTLRYLAGLVARHVANIADARVMARALAHDLARDAYRLGPPS